MLHTEFQGHWPLGSEKEDFYNVFIIWPSQSCDLDPYPLFWDKLLFPYSTDAPYEI